MNNRRTFLKKAALGGITAAAGLSFPFFALAKRETVKITILHTNDVHSRIEPFPLNDPKYPGMGGYAKRAKLINDIRNQEKNVLLFDSGDIWQGTPYFNFFDGELEFKLMSQMGYNATTIGNHDFDIGLDGLSSKLHLLNFPFICSNYDFSETVMDGKTIPFKVFEIESIRIGVFGIGIKLEGLVDPRLYGNTKYLEPLEKANEYALMLKEQQDCQLVVCLSHLGWKYKSEKISDVKIAENTENIDIILGGHTHTFLNEPFWVKNKRRKKVMICQVGWAGVKLGRIDLYFKKDTDEPASGYSAINI